MATSLFLPRRALVDPNAAPISAFESETQAVIQRTTPYGRRAILHVLAAMLVVSLVLMSVVKLDRMVGGGGRLLPAQGSFFVQPLDRAIVTGILVHPGDVVRKGQVLATLDPTFAEADLKDLQQKQASAEALVARLRAEQDGQAYVADPASSYSLLQASIWAQRRAEYRQSIGDFDAKIRAEQAVIEQNTQDATGYQGRLDLANEYEHAYVELKNRGFGSKLSLLNATNNRIEMQRLVGESRSAAAGATHELTAINAERAVYVSKWRDDVASQLVAARVALNEAQQELAKATKVSDLTSLTAPTDAVVLKVGRVSTGSVADPGGAADPLFTLTPLSGSLQAELRIPARDIGFIRPGDPVRVKLDAYRFTDHGVAKGVIKTLSDGSFTTTDDGQIVAPYYKAQVAITDARLRNVPAGFHLTPGLTVSGEVLVGKRSIMSYLLEGAMRTGSEAMREP
jgi:hemolysin D